jgi:tight adherence protein B
VIGLLAAGLAAVVGALLLLAFLVVPAGPGRVPLSRLDPAVAPPTSTLAGAGAVAGAAVEKALSKRGRLATLAETLEGAGIAMTPSDLVLLVALLGLVSGSVLGLLVSPWLIVPGLALAPVTARLVVSLKAARRRAAFADQLDDSLQLMASSLRAGHSLLRALDSVSQEAESPTAEEFARIVNETRVGRDLGDALEETADRMGSEDFRWTAQAISVHREVGGNLAEVLDAVGTTIRERNAIRRQVKALSAEGKLSAIVLMALPFGIAAFIAISNPAYLAHFTRSVLGWGMLGLAVVLLLAGGLWLKKMVSITF